MRFRVLGCSGGIGGRHLRTTSFLVDSDILIDAGTGVGDLTLAELSQIDHIFVTHSHLDHVASIPFLVDTIGGMRTKPIEGYTHRATLPPPRRPVRAAAPPPAGGPASLVFTGDTAPNDALWSVVNRIGNLKFLIIETAFSNKERHLAEISRHLCPMTLAEELKKLERGAEIYITHLKPGEIEPTMLEIEECAGAFRPRTLQNNLVLEVLALGPLLPRPRPAQRRAR